MEARLEGTRRGELESRILPAPIYSNVRMCGAWQAHALLENCVHFDNVIWRALGRGRPLCR